MNKLNFAFWGTPDVASETLEILKQAGYFPSLIVTSPNKPQGRKMIVTPPPVRVWAEKNNVPFLQPEKLDEEFTNKLQAISYELFIVVAYGKIMPEKIINLPELGSINIHYSLLPKYRGASPVESAILNGDTETGVTIQKMENKLDSGDIIAQEKTDIFPGEKAPELRERLIKLGGELLIKFLNTPSASSTSPYVGGGWVGVPQDESQASICRKIKKEDGLIDPNGDAIKNYNKFRAYAGWPRIFFFQSGKRVIITDAELADGKFIIKKVLPEGKKEIKYEEFMKARPSI